MPDQLKSFIQQHRNLIDTQTPAKHNLDSILTKIQDAPKREAIPFWKKNILSIAASLFIITVVAIWLTRNEIDMHEVDPAPVASQSYPSQNSTNDQQTDATASTTIVQTSPASSNHVLADKEQLAHIANTQVQYKSNNILKPKSNRTDIIHASNVAEPSQLVSLHQELQANSQIQIEPMIVLSPIVLKELSTVSKQLNSGYIPKPMPMHETMAMVQDDANEISHGESNISSVLTKELFGLINKKTKEWTDNRLQVQYTEREEQDAISLRFQSQDVQINRTLSLPFTN